jgi:hypothetical protein
METPSRIEAMLAGAMLTGKRVKKGKKNPSPFFTQPESYFLPVFLAPAFSPDFSAGLGAASFGLASGFFAMSVHLVRARQIKSAQIEFAGNARFAQWKFTAILRESVNGS